MLEAEPVVVLVALLDSLGSIRTTALAARVGNLLISQPAAPLDTAVVADIAALTSQVEQEMRERLGASSSSVLPAPQPPLPAPPLDGSMSAQRTAIIASAVMAAWSPPPRVPAGVGMAIELPNA